MNGIAARLKTVGTAVADEVRRRISSIHTCCIPPRHLVGYFLNGLLTASSLMATEAVHPSSKFLEETLAGAPSPRRTFLDATVLEETYGLTRVFHAAEKHEAGPVLVKDQPWEGWGPYLYGTVLRDGDRFKLWYTCIGKDSGFVCYATDHLLHWQRREFSVKEARAVKKIRFYLRNADLFSYWPKDLDARLDRGNREPR